MSENHEPGTEQPRLLSGLGHRDPAAEALREVSGLTKARPPAPSAELAASSPTRTRHPPPCTTDSEGTPP
jgi:hypothetical protein